MTMGLGNYAPELIFFLMGVNPLLLPVMMLEALIMPTTALNVIKMDRCYHRRICDGYRWCSL